MSLTNVDVSGGVMLNTCVWSGSRVNGSSFGGGFYLDIQMNFNPANENSSASVSWPAIWFLPNEYLSGSLTGSNWVEFDVFEAVGNSGDTICANKCWPIATVHDEGPSNANNQSSVDISSSLVSAFGKFDFAQMHHYQMLWVPQSKNGGAGVINWYVDGALMRTQSYSSSGAPNPSLSPTNRTGALAEADSQHFCLMLDPGSSATKQPINVGLVQIWQ
jgi:hypothetical protein